MQVWALRHEARGKYEEKSVNCVRVHMHFSCEPELEPLCAIIKYPWHAAGPIAIAINCSVIARLLVIDLVCFVR